MATPTIPNGEEHFFPIIYSGNGQAQRVGKFVPFTDNGTIAKSYMFNRTDNPRLARTPSSVGNRKTWTFSVWIKRAALGSARNLILTTSPSGGTAGGNSDANGIGNFKYSVPSGYLALCTKNLGS